ncbi:MAG: type II toxin-antitoxin system ParD family antitoxin [Phycisphaerae bacterium]|nr:type II toxin-antitoxin system ParD family antitoxin [Phycisphaerae bacterium]
MTTMNISLPEEMKTFVDEQVAKEGFSTASEFIRALLREAQKRAADERLEQLLLEGLDSGEPIEVTPEYWANLRARAAKRREKLKST